MLLRCESLEPPMSQLGQGQPRHSSGHHENRWSEVHPEANLRDHYRSTTALCQEETHAPQQTTCTDCALFNHLIGAGE